MTWPIFSIIDNKLKENQPLMVTLPLDLVNATCAADECFAMAGNVC
jgi:hypothetical protein